MVEFIQYWYCIFEGKLIAEKSFSRFYSSVILSAKPNQNPVHVLKSSLTEYNAILVNIEDSFEFMVDDYDTKDSENTPWFDWYNNVKQTNEPKFTPWQRFDE